MNRRGEGLAEVIVWLFVIALLVGVVGGGCYAWPKYNVYSSTMSGRAQLAEASSNRQIAVQEAQAKEESAKHLAQAEIERAKGVAEANKIIGNSLKQNEEYLTWLWIEALKEGGNDVIYVPTEANMPILEAGRMNLRHPSKVNVTVQQEKK